MLLLLALACTKDTSDTGGELVSFELLIENIGTAYPFVDSVVPGQDSLWVPLGSELTLMGWDGEQLLVSAPTSLYEGRQALSPVVVQLAEVFVIDGKIQLRQPRASVTVELGEDGRFSLSAEDLELYGVAHAPDQPAAGDGQEPAPWLESLMSGDADAGASGIAALTGVTHVVGAGFAGMGMEDQPLFEMGGIDRGMGLESLAEDGDPLILLDSDDPVLQRAVVFADQHAGGYEPLLPGSSTQVTIQALAGERLFFAAMLAQSNDLFVGSPETGIALFDGDTPRSGELQGELLLLDLGTEANRPPGVGSDQAPRQESPGDGVLDDDPSVREVDDGQDWPTPSAVMRLTLTPS